MELLTSAEAARLLGVGPTAVKRWADQGLLACVKTPGGHRRFERRVVEAFARREGQALSDRGRWRSWLELLVREGSVHRVVARLYDERANRGAWHLVAHDVGEVLREMGACWREGELTVAEEHAASSLLQRALAMAVESIAVGRAAPVCLLATAEGDDHTLGLSLVELCLREAGWRGEWLGRATRASDVLERVESGRVAMVALSASRSSRHPEPLALLVRRVGGACRRRNVALALGGDGAWPGNPTYGRRFRDLVKFSRALTRPEGPDSGYTESSSAGRGSAW